MLDDILTAVKLTKSTENVTAHKDSYQMKRRRKGLGMGRNGKKMNDEEEGIYRKRRRENEVAVVWGEKKNEGEKEFLQLPLYFRLILCLVSIVIINASK